MPVPTTNASNKTMVSGDGCKLFTTVESRNGEVVDLVGCTVMTREVDDHKLIFLL